MILSTSSIWKAVDVNNADSLRITQKFQQFPHYDRFECSQFLHRPFTFTQTSFYIDLSPSHKRHFTSNFHLHTNVVLHRPFTFTQTSCYIDLSPSHKRRFTSTFHLHTNVAPEILFFLWRSGPSTTPEVPLREPHGVDRRRPLQRLKAWVNSNENSVSWS